MVCKSRFGVARMRSALSPLAATASPGRGQVTLSSAEALRRRSSHASIDVRRS